MSGGSVHFILGGARSGKSRRAEAIANDLRLPVIYIATAEGNDPEMSSRIAMHQATRPEGWTVLEQPFLLPETIRENATRGVCILVDCLTLWLSNYLCSEQATQWDDRKAAFLDALNYAKQQGANVVLVSNEVGHGIVPMGALSRRFVDESGWLHQDVAAIANSVEFVMAGMPLTLKPNANSAISSERSV